MKWRRVGSPQSLWLEIPHLEPVSMATVWRLMALVMVFIGDDGSAQVDCVSTAVSSLADRRARASTSLTVSASKKNSPT